MEASAEPTAGEDDARVLIVLAVAVDGIRGDNNAYGDGGVLDVDVDGFPAQHYGMDDDDVAADVELTYEFGPDDYAYDLVSVKMRGEWRVVAVVGQ